MEQYRGGWQTLCPNAGAPRTVHGAPVGFRLALRRPERTVDRESLTRALAQVPPLPAGTHDRMRAEHDAIADSAVVDPYTGEEL